MKAQSEPPSLTITSPAIIRAPDASAMAEAAARLAAGQLVAFPTETVYGLGADATNPMAVARIFEAKGRPRFNPLIAHVADLASAEALALISEPARRLARRFWPGPLTLVLPRRPGAALADLATAGLPTVALRAPAHQTAQALLARFGGPLAAPSANLSGRLSPTTASDAVTAMAGRAALTLDGGPCAVGVESTIIALTPPRAEDDGEIVRLLRPGGLAVEDLEAVLGASIDRGPSIDRSAQPEAPGALASHYAPRARLRLNATAPRPGEAWLGFGADPPEAAASVAARNLSPAGDLREAAANLFASLRALDDALSAARNAAPLASRDDRGAEATIAVAPTPLQGLGLAIHDRLRRAAAPRGP